MRCWVVSCACAKNAIRKQSINIGALSRCLFFMVFKGSDPNAVVGDLTSGVRKNQNINLPAGHRGLKSQNSFIGCFLSTL